MTVNGSRFMQISEYSMKIERKRWLLFIKLSFKRVTDKRFASALIQFWCSNALCYFHQNQWNVEDLLFVSVSLLQWIITPCTMALLPRELPHSSIGHQPLPNRNILFMKIFRSIGFFFGQQLSTPLRTESATWEEGKKSPLNRINCCTIVFTQLNSRSDHRIFSHFSVGLETFHPSHAVKHVRRLHVK